MKRVYWLLCTAALAAILFGCTTLPERKPQAAPAVAAARLTEDRYLFGDVPTRTTYPNQWLVLTNLAYDSAYDETFAEPAWVAYRLAGVPPFPEIDRPPRGYPTDTRTTIQVKSAEFPSGYDRGHMAASEPIGRFYGEDAQRETFWMTNMLPQRHGLNAGPWKVVETAEYTTWTGAGREIWVFCGPVYTERNDEAIVPKIRHGSKKIAIPSACFKIVLTRETNGRVHSLAFIMPQEGATGNKPAMFLHSIRDVELRTGLNFFSSLPQRQQDEIEMAVATAVWP